MEKRKVKSQDTTLPQCIICDLDGTVAINQYCGWYDYEKVIDMYREMGILTFQVYDEE